MSRRLAALTALALGVVLFGGWLRPAAAQASLACEAVNDASGLAGKACQVLSSSKSLASSGKDLITGHVGRAVKSFKSILTGGSGASSAASTALGLAAIVTWVVTGAKFALTETTKVLGATTTPQLNTTWFSAIYWRIAGIAAVLTLPFLFAAAVQALLRSDLALLARAALGYLPLAMLAVGIAAPVTMLLLAATDQLCAAVSAAGGGMHLDLGRLVFAGAALAKGPFLVFLLGTITTMAALALWLELAIREAAVYVIVLMLPLAFAALVWPSRRMWVVRAVESLVALILAKFAIVAVLVLGGSALDRLGHAGFSNVTAGFAGTVLVLLATLSPWAVLRLLPMSELAAAAAGSLRPSLRGELQQARETPASAKQKVVELAEAVTAQMRKQAEEVEPAMNSGDDGRVARPRSGSGRMSSTNGTGDPREAADLLNGSDRAHGARSADGAKAVRDPAQPAEPAAEHGTSSERVPEAAGVLRREPLTLGMDADWLMPPPVESVRNDHDPLPPSQEPDDGRL